MNIPDRDAVRASSSRLLEHRAFQAAVRETRMPMAIADPNLPDAPLVYVNNAFTEMTGYEPAEAIGRNCRFLQGVETDPDTVTRIREAVAAHQPLDIEIYNYRRDGTGFWNALHLSPVNDGGDAPVYYFASQVDITQRREAARRQSRRAESMAALTTGVAHEFNNLLTVVVGCIERARDLPGDARQLPYLEQGDWAARRAGQFAADLLSLASLGNAASGTVDLNGAVRAGEAALHDVADGATLRLSLAPGILPGEVDAALFQRALCNLVRNAAEAMPQGGSLLLQTRELPTAEAAGLLGAGPAVEVSVSDTGPGMAPEVLARATELFFSTKKEGTGTGIGLFLVLEFLDRCNGKLLIESEPGRGTLVRMVFPAAPHG